jgi:hypothetical protein
LARNGTFSPPPEAPAFEAGERSLFSLAIFGIALTFFFESISTFASLEKRAQEFFVIIQSIAEEVLGPQHREVVVFRNAIKDFNKQVSKKPQQRKRR